MKSIIKIFLLIALFIFVFTITGNKNLYKNINATELDTFMEENPEATYIDVRTPEEFAQYNIEGFINIDSSVAVKEITDTYELNEPIVILCRSGSRSQQVSTGLVDNGFTNIYNVSNGIINY